MREAVALEERVQVGVFLKELVEQLISSKNCYLFVIQKAPV